MTKADHFIGVDFKRFKAFEAFSIELRSFNVLVGPNNTGKSTILAAFRILAAALRKAQSRKAELVQGPNGMTYGHKIDLATISVAEENLFYNYNDDEPASIRFRLASKNTLTLYFPERQVCYLVPDAQGRTCSSPTTFRSNFSCSIGFVPILGPVEHYENSYDREAARLALFNYGAARNFRNIWYHYPENFDEFRLLIKQTWPGMDVQQPEVDTTHDRPRLHMWCPENRKDREIFWSGFGFQVWCQMLTHVIQSKNVSLFLIDEPDIYLHSDLQRQLLGILRTLGPDILIATHSTEILTESETEDIVSIDKSRKRAVRIKSPAQLTTVFRTLGSGLNPTLTQLAKTRRVVFVEGADFQLLGRFARKLGFERIGNRSDFAVVQVEGFNPERIKSLKAGMEATLGTSIAAAAILDRDYRSAEECRKIENDCGAFCALSIIHESKEIENFLLVVSSIERAAKARLADRAKRNGSAVDFEAVTASTLEEFAEQKRHYVLSQRLASRRRYERDIHSGMLEETINQQEFLSFEQDWQHERKRYMMIPGKDALSAVNTTLQEKFFINVTPSSIVESMHVDEIIPEVSTLVKRLDDFIRSSLAP